MMTIRHDDCLGVNRHPIYCIILAALIFSAILTSLITMASPARAETQPGPILNDLPAASDNALRLVMVAIEGCPFCIRWQRQVGHIYSKSAEGKMAPLVRVRFGAKTLASFKNIKYTPTFLILRGKTEIGRIAGYPGADPFWEELGLILKKHKGQAKPKDEVQP